MVVDSTINNTQPNSSMKQNKTTNFTNFVILKLDYKMALDAIWFDW